jgi:cytochrome c oxidase subunit II
MTTYYAILTLAVTLAIAGVTLLVNSQRFPPAAAPAAASAVSRIRSRYFLFILAVTAIVLAFTLQLTPYPIKFAGQKPDVLVNVLGQTWSFTLTPVSGAASESLVLPVGKLVEFDVTSKDVNHNFAIYNQAGALIAQVQAMPGYTNRLFHRFDIPGHYYVLCLEYCGVGHPAMNTGFEVK